MITLTKPSTPVAGIRRPLVDWIASALQRDTLAKLLDRLDTDQLHPGDEAQRRYIAKILDEEVRKQFSDPRRPIIEVVLNAIDARASDAVVDPITVRIVRRGNSLLVSDDGRGMSLEDLLTTFLVPFVSEKDPLSDLGRFGIGFFSVLGYCLLNPGKTHVDVETARGDQAYRLSFWSLTDQASSLWLDLLPMKGLSRDPFARIGAISPWRRQEIAATTPRRGTRVRVRQLSDATLSSLDTYLEDQLRHFPPTRSLILFNGKALNGSTGGTFLSRRVAFALEDRVVPQDVSIGVRFPWEHAPAASDSLDVRLTSQGVHVRSVRHEGTGSCWIDLPAAVSLVEGRDEFKKDENYRRAVVAVFSLLLDRLSKLPLSTDARRSALDVIAVIAGDLQINSANDLAQRNAFTRLLFPTERYACPAPSHAPLVAFLGEEFRSRIHPGSHWYFSFWGSVLDSARPLVEQHVVATVDFPVSSGWWRCHAGPFPPRIVANMANAGHVSEALAHFLLTQIEAINHRYLAINTSSSPLIRGVQFVNLKGAGTSPFLIMDHTLYINREHAIWTLDPTLCHVLARSAIWPVAFPMPACDLEVALLEDL